MPVTRSFCFRRVAAASLVALLPLGTLAQTAAKPPPRLPPNASETSRIPSGVDTGSPATSDSLPLGTPVPPNASADRSELRTRSAAARAAARPKPTASSTDCTKRLTADASAVDAKAAPVALPKSGFVGSSAAPATAARATVARGPTRIDC
jgi:hypothetical protein